LNNFLILLALFGPNLTGLTTSVNPAISFSPFLTITRDKTDKSLATGCQKLLDIDEERKLVGFWDKRISNEVSLDNLGDEWKGYIARITGGNDKQGFPMKQGILSAGRVRLLFSKGHSCFRERRTGERRRKSVRGCIVANDLSVLSLVVVKKGEKDIAGLTDVVKPVRLGPKRANKIRKLFNLQKEDDVRKYVIRRELPPKAGKESKKPRTKAPKIQRLITPVRLQRKRRLVSQKRKKAESQKELASDYAKMLAQKVREQREKKNVLQKRRLSSRVSESQKS